MNELVRLSRGRKLVVTFPYDGLQWQARVKWMASANYEAHVDVEPIGCQLAVRSYRLMSDGSMVVGQRWTYEWPELDAEASEAIRTGFATQAVNERG